MAVRAHMHRANSQNPTASSQPKPPSAMSNPLFADDMWEIVESFIVETRELLDELDQQLLLLEENAHDQALVDEIFRAVHTIKGTSGFLSLEQISVLAHHFEDVLNRLRRRELDFHPAMMDVMLAAYDQMKVLLQQVADQRIVPLDLDDLIGQLNAISEGRFDVAASRSAALAEPAGVPAPTDGPTDAPAVAAPPASEAPPDAPPTAHRPEAVAAAHEPLDEDEATADDSGALGQGGGGDAAGDPARRRQRTSETIRVEVERLDALMNLVGELVLGRNASCSSSPTSTPPATTTTSTAS